MTMCPLRFVLVFLSAALAGFLAWKSIRSPAASPLSEDSREIETPRGDDSVRGRIFDAGKVIGKGFRVFVDMASGRYLWRAVRDRSQRAIICYKRGNLCIFKACFLQRHKCTETGLRQNTKGRAAYGRTSSTEKLVAITLGLLAILSPLYIDPKMTGAAEFCPYCFRWCSYSCSLSSWIEGSRGLTLTAYIGLVGLRVGS